LPASSASRRASPFRTLRFIGQLHGGDSACGTTGDALSDFCGRTLARCRGPSATAIDGYDLLFHDGLEGGSTTAWSDSTP
jgi:hypothetical protein